MSAVGTAIAGANLAISGPTGPATSGQEPAVVAPANETPANFSPRVDTFDYLKREVMIPMRDGVKLNTIVLVPNGAHDAPMVLTRRFVPSTRHVA